MKKIGFSLVLTLIALTVNAQESLTGYDFLRLPVSAHATALGGDNVSLIDDDESLIFQNPALLSSVSDRSVFLSYMRYMKGVNAGSAAFNRVLSDRAAWAVSGQYVHYGTMKRAGTDGIVTGEFTAKDIALTGYFSYLLTDRLAGGIATKIITSSLGEYRALAVGVDLGLNYYVEEADFSASLVARNLGGQLKTFNEEHEKMPISVELGATKRFRNTPFRLHAMLTDVTHWDYKFIYHVKVGIDALLTETIWIGAGYNFRQGHEMEIVTGDSERSSHGAGLSVGAGINLERFKLNLAYGKYHVSSDALLLNAAFTL